MAEIQLNSSDELTEEQLASVTGGFKATMTWKDPKTGKDQSKNFTSHKEWSKARKDLNNKNVSNFTDVKAW